MSTSVKDINRYHLLSVFSCRLSESSLPVVCSPVKKPIDRRLKDWNPKTENREQITEVW